MKAFLVVVAKKSSVPTVLCDEIKRRAPSYLGLESTSFKREKWYSASRRIALFSWTNEITREGQHDSPNLWVKGNRAVTMTGYSSDDVEVCIHRLLNQSSTAERRKFMARTGGLYTVCLADGEEDTVTIWNTITRIEPVYWCENSQYIFISSRALLAHLLCVNAATPEYDVKNLASFINAGFYNTEQTPYRNVKVLSPNSELAVVRYRVTVTSMNDVEKMTAPPTHRSAVYDEIAEAFVKGLKPLKRHETVLHAGLTGGKDSRLIVAALQHVGAPFRTHTSGYPEHPDVVVAQRIAKMLNVPHTVNTPTSTSDSDQEYVTHDVFQRTRDTLFVTDGMMYAYENISRPRDFNPNAVKLGGHGGELLRGGFSRNLNRHHEENMMNFFRKKFMKYNDMLRPEARKLYEKEIFDWIDLQREKHLKPMEILDKYYLYYRAGRWSAAARAAYTMESYLYQPFFDHRLVQLIQQIPAEQRVNEELIYNLLQRLAPELVDVPFAGDRWKFERNGPKKGEEEKWRKRTPLTIDRTSRGAFNWRYTTLLDMKDEFYAQILENKAADALFDVVDRDKVKKLFELTDVAEAREPQLNNLLWSLYSASVLLSNDWITDSHNAVDSRVVKIRVPGKNDKHVVPVKHFYSINELLKIEWPDEKRMNVSWTFSQNDKKLYVQLFDGAFSAPPSVKYRNLSTIPQADEVEFSFKVASKRKSSTLTVFFMQYDERKRVSSAFQSIRVYRHQTSCSLKFKLHQDARFYKLAIKINPDAKWLGAIYFEDLQMTSIRK